MDRTMKFRQQPKFRVDKETDPPRVFVQCSHCGTDIRELHAGERIKITQAYYCDECDPGVTVLNPPRHNAGDG